MATSYQPWYVNATYPAWDIPLNKDSGSDDITTVQIGTFTMTFRSTTGVDTPGTGSFAVKSLSPAEVYYKPSPADVAQPFTGFLFIKAFFPPSNSNLDEVVWDPIGGDPNNKSVPFAITPS